MVLYGEGFRFREENGQFAFRRTFLEAAFIHDFAHAMRRITSQNQEDLGQFSDFIFVTQGIGLKQTMELLSTTNKAARVPWQHVFPDLDWSLVFPDLTYVDLGSEYYPEDTSSRPMTGIWAYDPNAAIGHEGLLESFLGTQLQQTWYPLDQFSLVRGLGGFSYRMPVPSSGGENQGSKGITKITAYMKVKQPFYHRRNNTDRLGKDFSPSEVWCNGEGLAAHLDFMEQTCRAMTRRSYGARLELRMQLEPVETQLRGLSIYALQTGIINLRWCPTADIAELWAGLCRAIGAAAANVSFQGEGRFSQSSLTLVSLVSAMGSALTSRPDDTYKFRPIWEIVRQYPSPASDLTLVPNLIARDHIGALYITRTLELPSLRNLFQPRTWREVTSRSASRSNNGLIIEVPP